MRQIRDATWEDFNTIENTTGARKGGERSFKKTKLDLNNYKFHALGDYVATIRLFGTTDSYSTQVVSSVYRCIVARTKVEIFTGGTRTSPCQAALWAD